jgi:hypothetical protein
MVLTIKPVAVHMGVTSQEAMYLLLIVKRDQLAINTSEKAAECHSFKPNWGRRNVRSWTHQWLKEQKLPESRKGWHRNVYSLLDDPMIKAELCAFLHSNNWVMNPAKLAEFTHGKLLPTAADKYLKHLVQEEMPCGKKYMEIELFL